MGSVLVGAEPSAWQQASRFASKALGEAQVKSFEDLRRQRPSSPVLLYLTNPDYRGLRSLLQGLRSASADVVIYYANRLEPGDAAQLGKLVGETRPKHTSVVFEAKAAAASVLKQTRSHAKARNESGTGVRLLRERLGLTQTEIARALGVSLRTVQNWERGGPARALRELRDLEELWTILKDSIETSDVPTWVRTENDAFRGKRPIDLLEEGKARDIIVEFRRLQSGEPA